ncbi:alpha/beta hydrolase [Ruegeria arenilitoris]|uniref:alpha/beta hydrolase n=1 Tax=Ruegeria arenilitoris TaxID=1173585 RepID=UPI001C2C56C8|nr:alpha/beta hydrolase [Ruegeria arenilitoris]
MKRLRIGTSDLPRAFRLLCLSTMMLLGAASCGRPPELVGIDNPRLPASEVKEAKRQTVFIATTRQASGAEGVFFSGDRGEGLGLASVVVTIPPIHKAGKIERASSLPPIASKHFTIVEPKVYVSEAAFVSEIDNQLLNLSVSDRNVLVFVHGYNTTLSDAILRLAQFVEDTEYDGIPVLMSWASAAETLKYVYDINSALAARSDFLKAGEIISRSQAQQFDILAFSMGAFLTMEAISQAEIAGEFNPNKKIRNIILAAPDIDLAVFESQLSTITHDNQKIFVLVSSDDGALSFSKFISGGVDRVGAADAAELARSGVTVIDLSQVQDSQSTSHSKFASSPEVVRIAGEAIRTSGRTGRRSTTELQDLIGEGSVEVVGEP